MSSSIRTLLCGATSLLFACDTGAPDRLAGPSLTIEVAPLSLAGITDASYRVSVFNAFGDKVWEKTTLTSEVYGNGAGDLTYIGTCDATINPALTPPSAKNRVELELLTLSDAAGPLAVGTWVVPPPISKQVDCIENTDALVAFNLTVMRDAKQGFFDIAVEFDDIFCSAKVDCVDDLLHSASTGERVPTMVFGLVCASGESVGANLYLSDITLQCDNQTYTLDPAGEPGNQGEQRPMVAQAAIYREMEALGGTTRAMYWNTALGLDMTQLDSGCVLVARATASPLVFEDGQTPPGVTMPVIDVRVPVTNDLAELACETYPLGSPEVATTYTSDLGESFAHRMSPPAGSQHALGPVVATIESAANACDTAPFYSLNAFSDADKTNFSVTKYLQNGSNPVMPAPDPIVTGSVLRNFSTSAYPSGSARLDIVNHPNTWDYAAQNKLVVLDDAQRQFGIVFHASPRRVDPVPSSPGPACGNTVFFVERKLGQPPVLEKVFGPGDPVSAAANDTYPACGNYTVTWVTGLRRANGDTLVAFTYLNPTDHPPTQPSDAVILVYRKSAAQPADGFQFMSRIASAPLAALTIGRSGMWFPTLYEQAGAPPDRRLVMVAVEQEYHPTAASACSAPGSTGLTSSRDDIIVLLRFSEASQTWSKNTVYQSCGSDQNETAITEIVTPAAGRKLAIVFHSRTNATSTTSTLNPNVTRDGDIRIMTSPDDTTWTAMPSAPPLLRGPFNNDLRYPNVQSCGGRVFVTYTKFVRWTNGDLLWNSHFFGLFSPDAGASWVGPQLYPREFETFVGPSPEDSIGYVTKGNPLTFGVRNRSGIAYAVGVTSVERCAGNCADAELAGSWSVEPTATVQTATAPGNTRKYTLATGNLTEHTLYRIRMTKQVGTGPVDDLDPLYFAVFP